MRLSSSAVREGINPVALISVLAGVAVLGFWLYAMFSAAAGPVSDVVSPLSSPTALLGGVLSLASPTPLGGRLVVSSLAPSATLPPTETPTLTATPSDTPSPTETPTETPTLTATPSDTPLASVWGVVNTRGLNVRYGPGRAWPVMHVLTSGEFLRFVGRSQDDAWGALANGGWVRLRYVDVSGDVDLLPLASYPAAPF